MFLRDEYTEEEAGVNCSEKDANKHEELERLIVERIGHVFVVRIDNDGTQYSVTELEKAQVKL